MTPEELKREDEFLEAQAKAIRERTEAKRMTDAFFSGLRENLGLPLTKELQDIKDA